MDYRLLVAALASMASACAVLGPPPASVRIAPAPAQPGPASFTPSSWLGSLDRQGLSPMTLTASGTVADDWAGLMPENDADEDEADGLVSGEKIAPILAMEAVSYDVPQADDPRVRMWVDYLSGRGRESFGRWLARSTRYVPVFWPILEQYDLPKDLVFLSMVESGFSPRAYSWAHASGAWQFMPATGRRFGLRNGFWVDERRDFVKATHAAAKYLSALYDRFGHWYLAFAAYNAGPGRVSKAIRRTRTKNFWRISRTRRLKRETKHYVPKILAAARVAKQPEAYGFGDLEYLPPLRWDNLHLDEATDLKTVAQACGLESPEPLQVLNPELRARVTPPGVTYPLRVPVDTVDKCQKGLAAMSPKERYTYRYHDVRPSDDLKRIARLYSTTATAIANFNEIASGRLDQFDELVVPVKLVDAGKAPIVKPTIGRFRPAAYGPASSQVIVHRVRSGDSLWRIARRYRVSIRKLRLWNGLWRTNTLRVGQRLRIHGGRGRVPGRRQARRIVRNAKRHRVRAGESLWSIAARHGTSIDRLCRLNGMKRSDKLRIGRVLRIR